MVWPPDFWVKANECQTTFLFRIMIFFNIIISLCTYSFNSVSSCKTHNLILTWYKARFTRQDLIRTLGSPRVTIFRLYCSFGNGLVNRAYKPISSKYPDFKIFVLYEIIELPIPTYMLIFNNNDSLTEVSFIFAFSVKELLSKERFCSIIWVI